MTTVFLLNGTTSWTVPADWSATNTIEAIGCGGNGALGTASAVNGIGGAGGGGGEYRRAANVAGLSGSITVAIAAGGAATDTTFNATTVIAKPGGNASGATPGTGGTGGTGAAANFNGGNGGTPSTNIPGGGGGGGAAGPSGAGKIGGATTTNSGGGGGGGANNGAVGNPNSTTTGGAGGNGNGGTGGGPGGAILVAGTAGTAGTGGGGGAGGGSSTPVTAGAGAVGASDQAFDASHGAGAGGGGGGGCSSSGTGGAGANGAVYGGGGGGAGGCHGSGSAATTRGLGANGLIIITYTPASSTPIFYGNNPDIVHGAAQAQPGYFTYPFGIVTNEVVFADKWQPQTPAIINRYHYDYNGVSVLGRFFERINTDKWEPYYPDRAPAPRRAVNEGQTVEPTLPPALTFESWPVSLPRFNPYVYKQLPALSYVPLPAAEIITADKWIGFYPSYVQRKQPLEGQNVEPVRQPEPRAESWMGYAPTTTQTAKRPVNTGQSGGPNSQPVPTLDVWAGTSSPQITWRGQNNSNAAFVPIVSTPEVITPDKWLPCYPSFIQARVLTAAEYAQSAFVQIVTPTPPVTDTGYIQQLGHDPKHRLGKYEIRFKEPTQHTPEKKVSVTPKRKRESAVVYKSLAELGEAIKLSRADAVVITSADNIVAQATARKGEAVAAKEAQRLQLIQDDDAVAILLLTSQ